jgi:hypothetical protein
LLRKQSFGLGLQKLPLPLVSADSISFKIHNLLKDTGKSLVSTKIAASGYAERTVHIVLISVEYARDVENGQNHTS